MAPNFDARHCPATARRFCDIFLTGQVHQMVSGMTADLCNGMSILQALPTNHIYVFWIFGTHENVFS